MKKASRLIPGILFVLAIAIPGCSGNTVRDQSAEKASEGPAVPLFDNLGEHHHSVTTSNELAQKFFDQGLRFVYGFNHDEAERAFREAARLDPDCAMAWWGVAVALGPNINLPLDDERNKRALDAVEKAQALSGKANDVERAYISSIATRYSSDSKVERAQLDRKYSEAMAELSRRHPEDNDAAVLYAESLMDLKPWQLWTADGRPQDGTLEIMRVLEQVLAREPNHPGANHYYIHAVEASPDPGRALPSAMRLKTLVPGAGHLVHMPAHIFARTGAYEAAVEANANAVQVDAEYIARTNAEGIYPMMYYTHNFMFLSWAAGMIGESGKALESAAKAVNIAGPMVQHEPMAEYVLPWSLFAMLRSGKWEDVLNQARPADSTPSALALWHYARSIAHIAKRELNEARRDRAEFMIAKSKTPADFMLNINRAQDVLSVAESVLDARLAAASGDRTSAVALWNKAVAAQDRLNYDEPPAWYYPIRESLGGEYLRQGRFADAEQVFLRDLELNPNNARALFGLREALKGQSKNLDDVTRRLDSNWKSKEIQLSVDSL